MTRRLAAVACGVIAVLGVVLAGQHGAQADDGDVARSMLIKARGAVADHDFRGTVLIQWQDGGKRHQSRVTVRTDDGVMHVGDDRLVGSGGRQLLRTDDGWQLLWAGRTNGAEPDPTGKYRFEVSRTAPVAKRPATQVTVRRAGSDAVRERMYFDDATGVLLRRDQLDASGHVVRRFAFVDISDPKPAEHGVPEALPKVSAQSARTAPRAIEDLPDDLQAPKRIGKDFALTGVYSQPDGSVQLYYSDGLLGLSVFERAGELAWDSLPDGGRTVELGGAKTRVYATAGGSAVVWGDEDATYTVVTDAPLDEIDAAAASFSPSDDTGVLGDVGRFVTAPFSWN